jgi:hypothetical protein
MFEPDLEIEVWNKDHEQGEGYYWIASCKKALDAVRIADAYKAIFKVDARVFVFDHPRDRVLYETKHNNGSYAEKAAEVHKRLKQSLRYP